MSRRNFVLTATVACAVGWFGGTVWSEDPAVGEVDWEKFGQPAEEHARLKAFVGEWTVGGSGPGGELRGNASTTAIYGGRYIAHDFKGQVGEMPFEGRGLLGYDKGAKQWKYLWIDSYSTNIMLSEGEEKQRGKVWEFKGKFVGPDGKPVEMRDVYKVVSDKEYTIESYMGGGDQAMSLRFRRK